MVSWISIGIMVRTTLRRLKTISASWQLIKLMKQTSMVTSKQEKSKELMASRVTSLALGMSWNAVI